jgi:hypothetical protein
MKTNSTYLALATLAAIGVLGCKKDNTPTPATTGGLSSLAAFIQQNGAPTQTFTINPGTIQTVTGTKGTVVTFPANCFVTTAGAPVSGNVTVTLREIYGKKNMLLSDVTTISEFSINGSQEPLVSGGEINVTATQNGNKLKLAHGVAYRAFLPSTTTPDPNLSCFIGRVTPSGLIWDQHLDSTTFNGVNTSTAPLGLFMSCDSLGWGNADRFLSAPQYSQVSLNITGTFDPTQIKAYAWYDNENLVWPFWHAFNSITNVYIDTHTAINFPLHLIVISVKNGKLYTAIQAATLVGNDVINMNLVETDQNTFMANLALLP